MPPTYTAEVGRKFNADGSLRHYPGLTVICPVLPGNPAYAGAVWVAEQLRAQSFAPHLFFLPPESYHMTLIALVNDQRRDAGWWPKALPLDAPLAQVDDYFIQAMSHLTPMTPPPMRATGMTGWLAAAIALETAEPEGRWALDGYRDAIAVNSQLRRPDHDGYQFHITVAYRIIEFDSEMAKAEYEAFRLAIAPELQARIGAFTPEPPELTFYDDMGRFVPAAERHTLLSRR
jgi:hypothetical protein